MLPPTPTQLYLVLIRCRRKISFVTSLLFLIILKSTIIVPFISFFVIFFLISYMYYFMKSLMIDIFDMNIDEFDFSMNHIKNEWNYKFLAWYPFNKCWIKGKIIMYFFPTGSHLPFFCFFLLTHWYLTPITVRSFCVQNK